MPSWDLWAGELIFPTLRSRSYSPGTYSRGTTGREFLSRGHKIAKPSRKRAFPESGGRGKPHSSNCLEGMECIRQNKINKVKINF